MNNDALWEVKKIVIDEEADEMILGKDGRRIPLYSPEGFKILSALWLKVGWDQKHMYSFSWFGRPIIQIPEDCFRVQEVIYEIKPDVILETGIAHGGSLIFYASLCKAMGHGRVIGIDIEIRPHNRTALEAHELFPFITMIEGDSSAHEVREQAGRLIRPGEKVMVILDAGHTYAHVMKELELYSTLVSPGSYIVATDGSRAVLGNTPRAKKQYADTPSWEENNPLNALQDFVKTHPDFAIVEPKFPFNESPIDFRITHWPSAFIKRMA